MDAGSAESVTRELRMLTSLVGYVSSTQQAEQLTQLFLPYLRIKPTPRAEKVKAQVLGLLAGLLPMLEAPEVHARFLGLQFGNLRSRESRAALCRAWVALATEVDARARGTASTARGDGPMSHNGAGVVARSFHIGGDPCDQPALHGLGRVATLLEELNAYALDAIEERDYDRRIDGYNSVPEILAGGPLPLPPSGQSPDPASPSPPPVSSGLGCVAALPLLCQCVHDIETDDIALRHSASHTLTLIVRHAAQHISGHAASGASPAAVAPACSLVDPSEGATDASLHVLPSSGVGGKRKKKAAAATPAADIPAAPPAGISSAPPPPGISPAGPEWRSLLVDVLLPALRRGLRLPPERDMVRAEMIRLLAEALTAAPFLEPQLAALLNRQDPEADFFFNVVHVQLPRRQRALARLRQRVDKVRLLWG
jgi:U3 small nucleolar RNA-associated protein 20